MLTKEKRNNCNNKLVFKNIVSELKCLLRRKKKPSETPTLTPIFLNVCKIP